MKKKVFSMLIFGFTFSLASTLNAAVFEINGFTIIDNDPSKASFTSAGFDGADIGANNDGGFNFTRLWGNSGAATTASWNFGTGEDPTLAAGIYEVYVSWRNVAQSNLNDALYSGSDGFAPITVDQSPGSLSYAGTLGVETFYAGGIYAPGNVSFVRLGSVLVADGTFTLTVTDDALDPDFIFADAAALRATVPEPSALMLLLGGLGLMGAVARRRVKHPVTPTQAVVFRHSGAGRNDESGCVVQELR